MIRRFSGLRTVSGKYIEQEPGIANHLDGIFHRKGRSIVRLPGADGGFNEFRRDPVRYPRRDDATCILSALAIGLSIAAGHRDHNFRERKSTTMEQGRLLGSVLFRWQ